jgi:hypothetical protein
MRVCVVTMLTHVDACVAKTWTSYRRVPCHPWCTHRTSLVVKKEKKPFSVFLWLWTVVIVINACNHGEHYETPCIYMRNYLLYSSVGMANHYGTDGSEIESRRKRDFSHSAITAPKVTQPPMQMVQGLFPRTKAAGVWLWQPLPRLTPMLKKEYSYNSIPPLDLHRLFYGELYLFFHYTTREETFMMQCSSILFVERIWTNRHCLSPLWITK